MPLTIENSEILWAVTEVLRESGIHFELQNDCYVFIRGIAGRSLRIHVYHHTPHVVQGQLYKETGIGSGPVDVGGINVDLSDPDSFRSLISWVRDEQEHWLVGR